MSPGGATDRAIYSNRRTALVATTWFKQEDVVYYLKTYGSGRKLRVLDFKKHTELVYSEGERLRRGPAF